MKSFSRRTFSGAVLSVSALGGGAGAQRAGECSQSGSAAMEGISGRRRWFRVSGRSLAGGPSGPCPARHESTLPGGLPALFERTIEIDAWSGGKSQLRMDFTGPCGGFTVGSWRRQGRDWRSAMTTRRG